MDSGLGQQQCCLAPHSRLPGRSKLVKLSRGWPSAQLALWLLHPALPCRIAHRYTGGRDRLVEVQFQERPAQWRDLCLMISGENCHPVT